MDLYEVLAHLAAERKRVDDLIRALEGLQLGRDGEKPVAAPSRRGRKSMGQEERLEVSQRMQRYWEERRAAQRNADSKDDEAT